MLHVTIRQLKIFEAVARQLSITRAAEELHLSQPAVSMQMKKLAEAVGQPLMEQEGKRVRLTGAGQELVGTARDVLMSLKRFELGLVARKGLSSGYLRLAAITTATYFVPRLLGEFAKLYPGVKVTLRVFNREQALESLAGGLEDLYVLGQPPEDLPVTAEPFLTNPLVVIAHPDHALAHKRRIPLRHLADEPWLMREPGSGTRKAVERLFAGKGLAIAPRMELGGNEAIKQAVLAKLGIAVLSRHTLALHRSDLFAILDVEGFPILRQWHAVYPARKPLTVVARTFLDFLLAYGREYDTRPA